MSVLAPGMRLSDRFTLRGVVGVGGMAEVWRADDAVLGRPVAVKVLTASLAGDAAFRSATFAEARAAARLTHPHVTQIHDYGEAALPDGSVLPYLVMELVEGETLADRLRSGPLPWAQAAAITSQVASALAAAHRIGIVHRDIKPANVMLTRSGAKVLDFGIAALDGSVPGAYAGKLVGTPAYAAPELLHSRPATPASDVYALGALFYEATTGRPPITAGDWRQAADAHRHTPIAPPDAPGLPRQLRRLCMACLAADPAQRPTAEDLEHRLTSSTDRPATATTVMPTIVAEPSLAAAAPAASYAVGAARPPAQPTMIEPGMSAAAGDDLQPVRRLSRPLLALLVAAVLVVTVAVIAVANLLSSGGSEHNASPPASPTAEATTDTTTEAAAPSPTPSATQSTSTSTGTSPQAIVDQLNAAIDSDLAAGKIDSDTASSLRDKVKDLGQSLHGGGDHGKKHKVGENAQELQQRINELLNEGKIDQQTADQLNAILQPLLGNG